jgi:O-methyltransferase domain/Dimerisation domain
MSTQGQLTPSLHIPPPAALMQMATGYWVSQAVYVVAKLGIADLLQAGPKSLEELAQATGADRAALSRLLRALVSLGVFTEKEQGCFAQTPLSACLQTSVPGSLRAMVTLLNEEEYRAWGEVLHSVKTGGPAFDHVFGMGLFPYLEQHPETAAVFNAAMTDYTSQVAAAVVQAYDFSGFRTIVDVGGRHGTLLTSVLKAYSSLRGVLFDTAAVSAGAKQHIDAAGLSARCEVVAGDFFEAVPSGGDAYLLSQILHDWEDERSITILKNCHRAMAERGKLLVIETVIAPGSEPSFGKLFDLHMMVVTGGRERTEAEYRALFARAGFQLTRVIPTQSVASVVEAVRV